MSNLPNNLLNDDELDELDENFNENNIYDASQSNISIEQNNDNILSNILSNNREETVHFQNIINEISISNLDFIQKNEINVDIVNTENTEIILNIENLENIINRENNDQIVENELYSDNVDIQESDENLSMNDISLNSNEPSETQSNTETENNIIELSSENLDPIKEVRIITWENSPELRIDINEWNLKYTNPPSQITLLPDDLIIFICSFLKRKDFLKLSLLSNSFYKKLENDILWDPSKCIKSPMITFNTYYSRLKQVNELKKRKPSIRSNNWYIMENPLVLENPNSLVLVSENGELNLLNDKNIRAFSNEAEAFYNTFRNRFPKKRDLIINYFRETKIYNIKRDLLNNNDYDSKHKKKKIRIKIQNLILLLTSFTFFLFLLLGGLLLDNIIPQDRNWWLFVYIPVTLFIFTIFSLMLQDAKKTKFSIFPSFNDKYFGDRIQSTYLLNYWVMFLAISIGVKLIFFRNLNVWQWAIIPSIIIMFICEFIFISQMVKVEFIRLFLIGITIILPLLSLKIGFICISAKLDGAAWISNASYSLISIAFYIACFGFPFQKLLSMTPKLKCRLVDVFGIIIDLTYFTLVMGSIAMISTNLDSYLNAKYIYSLIPAMIGSLIFGIWRSIILFCSLRND